MKPSFLSLFKRGGYCHRRAVITSPIGETITPETIEIHREQERYVAAAVAFCFKHDLKFREHFWAKICRCPGDPSSASYAEIEVEPASWADLLVRTDTPQGNRFVHVIECKINAPLQPHQNPRSKQFHSDGGYGLSFVQNQASTGSALRYILLGCREDLNLPSCHYRIRRIKLAQCLWDALLDAPETALTNDLFDLLAEMHVGSFGMRKFKDTIITTGLHNAAKAWGVLDATIGNLQLIPNYCDHDANDSEDGWAVGAFIKAPPPKKYRSQSYVQKQLQQLLQVPDSKVLAWFGYESPNAETIERSVWLYCSSETVRKEIITQLKRKSRSSRQDEDGGACIVINDKGSGRKSDIEWFSETIRMVASLAS